MTEKLRTFEITINRTIPATPEEVFDAWLDPGIACNPWHGAKRIEWEPAQGNLWYFLHVMSSDKAQPPYERPHFGRFRVLDRPRKIVLDWMSYNTRGMESVVTVTLHPKGDETLLSLNHANIPDDELGRAHEKGWAQLTGQLEALFVKK